MQKYSGSELNLLLHTSICVKSPQLEKQMWLRSKQQCKKVSLEQTTRQSTVMLTVKTFLYQQSAGKQKRSGGIGCSVDQFFDDLKVSAPPFAYLIALAMVSHFNDVSFFRKYC